MSEPREWCLGKAAWAPKGRLVAYEMDDFMPWNAIHVIEKSAFDELQEKLDYAQDDCRIQQKNSTYLARELRKLREESEKLAEALAFHVERCGLGFQHEDLLQSYRAKYPEVKK